MLLVFGLIGAGAFAVNSYLTQKSATTGVELSIAGYPVRSIGLLAGMALPLLLGGPIGWIAAAFGVGCAWPLIAPSWGQSAPQIPQTPPGGPPPPPGY